MNAVYILRCGDGTLYTGWTNDLEKRLRAHAAGKGAKEITKKTDLKNPNDVNVRLNPADRIVPKRLLR